MIISLIDTVTPKFYYDVTPPLVTMHSVNCVCVEERMKPKHITPQQTLTFSNIHSTLCAEDGDKGVHSQMMKVPEENFVLEIHMNKEEPPYGVAMQSSAGIGGSSKDVAQTLINGDNPGWQTGAAEKPSDEPHYIVRRLTPTECARLQGFPDAWCSDLAIPNPTEEELDYWQSVWDTWQDLNGLPRRPRSAVKRWLTKPYTDAAEYKMWGNGVALPCVYFILSGIEWASSLPIEEPKPVEKAGQLSIFDL